MRPRIVGVILSTADLRRALRLRRPPDFFELRLDSLSDYLDEVRRTVGQLRAPLIITARHPSEGGLNDLSRPERRALLLQFLPRAKYIDVELRSARAMRTVLRAARARRLRTIISFHEFDHMPPTSRLEQIAMSARSLGADLIKIAVRTDTVAELTALLEFFRRQRGEPRVVAMGIGKLGRVSRLKLLRRGCVLNYAHLGSRAVAGQLSLQELRRFTTRLDSVS